MNYNLMHQKLEEVRKEIRKNIPHLNIIDHLNQVMDEQRKRVIWYGTTKQI